MEQPTKVATNGLRITLALCLTTNKVVSSSVVIILLVGLSLIRRWELATWCMEKSQRCK